MIDSDAKGRLLARAIASDIRLYNAEKIRSGGDLSAEIEEGRQLFRERVAPAHHAVFEEEIAALCGGAPAPRAPFAAPPVAPLAAPLAGAGVDGRFASFYLPEDKPAPRRTSAVWVAGLLAVAAALAVWLLAR